ncbi:MAG: hypothetical protein QG602_2127 [Verrucomicrobiota bacterium]|nr:hypothetical protein [Verrucomicrobiota bacterium]
MKTLVSTIILSACTLAPATPPGPPLWPIVVGDSCALCCFRYELDVAGCEGDTGEPDDPCQAVRVWAYEQWRECIRYCDDPDLPLRVFDLWSRGKLSTDQMIETLVAIEDEACLLPIHRSRRVFAGSAG